MSSIYIGKNFNLNGTFLVAKNSKIFSLDCFGFADKEQKIKSSPNTRYLLGSVTKHIIAAATLRVFCNQFVSDSVINSNSNYYTIKIIDLLNQPIAAYLTNDHAVWENNMPYWAEKITIHNLLTHTSGLADYKGDKEFRSRFISPPNINAIFKYIKKKELLFEPGTKHAYCTAGYIR